HPARPYGRPGRRAPAATGVDARAHVDRRHRRDSGGGDPMTLRIVVADDHAVVREGLRALLAAVDGYELVGTASNGPEAVRAAVTLKPDVMVMDIQMPQMNGIEATREIGRVAPEVAVLMLT